jgi:hypothetical protein
MGGASRPSVKLNEVYRLQPTLAGLLGNFILNLLTPLGIAEWIGYVFPLRFVSRLTLQPAVSLSFIALACAGLIRDVALPLMLRHLANSSTFLVKQGTI